VWSGESPLSRSTPTRANRPLQSQIDELMAFVRSCEELWNGDFGDIDRLLTDC